MNCPHCAFENPPGMAFCGRCGTRLPAGCPSCGFANPEGFAFCGKCGARLTTKGSPPPLHTVSPEAYTPKHLAEKILTSLSALEGERKQVTVLFADLKGSMELLADRDPEDARKVLDPVLTLLMEAVHRYEGTVNQVMGDGIMALFGAPLAHEDHAVRACYAALRMQESVKRYGEEVRRSHGATVQIRVGLNSGEVVVRAIGSDLHMDYTAVGQTTHLAARMEQLASPGSIFLTTATVRLAEGYVAVKPLGPVPVKGLASPLELFELIGAGAARSRLQAAAARGLTKFIGRAGEMDQLAQALERARAGHGQVVAVVGEPGVGKSRLFYEFIHSHRTQGWLILESSSVAYGKATAYLPAIDLLKGYFKIQDHDDTRAIQEKVIGKVMTLDRALEDAIPAVLGFLEALPEDSSFRLLDPPQRRKRTLDAIKRLLLCESRVQPVILVFEDLHWIDPETQVILDSIVESLPTARVLLVVNYRPEYQHGWGGKTYYTQLRIDPLPPVTAEELLQVLLGDDAGLRQLKQLLVQRTEGNPFFLEESVRTLVEERELVGERGNYRLVKADGQIQVPPTVQAVLASRIDRLAPEEKRLLQAASAIGKDVPFALLQAITEESEEVLRRGLSNLQAAEFLYETQLFPEPEYTFKHGLTHEVAYRSLPLEKRRAYHGQIAKALEGFFPDRLEEKTELLAHHYLQSGNAEKALDYLARAAEKAAARFAALEGSRYYEEASRYYEGIIYEGIIACLDQLPKTEERERQRIDLRLGEADMVWMRGRSEQAYRILEEIQAIAERIGDLPRLAQIHFKVGWYLFNQMDLDGAFAHYQECFTLCERLGQLEKMREIYWALGSSCRSVSVDVNIRRQRAIEFHEKGLALAEAAHPQVIQYDPHNAHFPWLIYLLQLGDLETAMAYLHRGERIAKALPEGVDVLNVALMKGSMGLSHLLKGEWEAESCLDLLRGNLEAAERVSSHILTMIGQHLLAMGYFFVGDFSRALPHFQVALRHPLFLPGALLLTAETEARLGLHAEAMGHLGEYERLIGKAGSFEGLAWFPSPGACHRVYGIVFARRGELEKASQHFGRSIQLLSAHGYKPDLARSYAALGQFLQEEHRLPEAREQLERAVALFREMGFGRELAQTLSMRAAI